MSVLQAEWSRWWRWLWRGWEGPALAAAGVAVPVAAYWLVTAASGVIPLPSFAVLASVVPLSPVVWALAGVRWASLDRRDSPGSFRASWPASRLALTGAGTAALLATGLGAGLLAALGLAAVLGIRYPAGWALSLGAVPLAALILGLPDAFMLAWGAVVGTVAAGRWATLLAIVLPVAGLAAGTALPAGSSSPFAGLAPLMATTPWGWFVNKFNAAFGFGPYVAAFGWTATGTALPVAAGAAAAVGRARRWTLRERPAAWAVSLLWAGFVAAAALAALAKAPQAVPLPGPAALAQARGGALASEQLTLTFEPGGRISAAARITAAGSGTVWLWLNPQLTVRSVARGAQVLAVRRRTDGLLALHGRGPFTIRYAGTVTFGPNLIPEMHRALAAMLGTPLTIPNVLTAFSAPGSDLLPAGTWYPIPAADFAHPREPAVMRLAVHVARTGSPPPVLLSNLGQLYPGHTRERTSTGVVLVGGQFVATALPGAQVWSGPTAALSWRQLPPNTLGWSTGFQVWRRVMRTPARPVLVAEAWGPGASLMRGLGNPNPVEWDRLVGPHQRDALVGVFTALEAPYSETASMAPPAVARNLWAQLSPRWAAIQGGMQLAIPPWQRPALSAMSSLNNIAPSVGIVWHVSASSTLFRHWPTSAEQAYFQGLRRLLHHGWPTAPNLTALAQAALHEGRAPS